MASLLAPDSGWEADVTESNNEITGFRTLQRNAESKVGEIGLNAVHPGHAGCGVGTAMYEFALARMREAGTQAAKVGTGAVPSHAPARRTYEKVGFTAAFPNV